VAAFAANVERAARKELDENNLIAARTTVIRSGNCGYNVSTGLWL
jgi:hypothetical protein